MNLRDRYTFTMETFDEVTGETCLHIERKLDDATLDDLREAFLHFLWNCTFSYVENVEIHRTKTRW